MTRGRGKRSRRRSPVKTLRYSLRQSGGTAHWRSCRRKAPPAVFWVHATAGRAAHWCQRQSRLALSLEGINLVGIKDVGSETFAQRPDSCQLLFNGGNFGAKTRLQADDRLVVEPAAGLPAWNRSGCHADHEPWLGLVQPVGLVVALAWCRASRCWPLLEDDQPQGWVLSWDDSRLHARQVALTPPSRPCRATAPPTRAGFLLKNGERDVEFKQL